jgi:predicted Zn-dependent protease with MMP-like domain
MAPLTPSRRTLIAALTAACAAVVIVTLYRGLSPQLPLRLAQVAACSVVAVAVLGTVLGALTRQMADYREPADDDDFERLVRRSERLAARGGDIEPDDDDFSSEDVVAARRDPHDPQVFEQLVREALDELPDILLRALRHVAVVISDDGRRHHAYGLYQGDTVARDGWHDRIVIFRDTLLRDFGDDPDELRGQVTRTVRHELAHHLGADELGVRDLGL